jgi:hypothetical protein
MAQTKRGDRLMSDAEYKTFLDDVEAKLPSWEAALKRFDPAKSNMSYAVGDEFVKRRDLALRQIDWIRTWIQKERSHRRVSQEHALEGFMQGVFDEMEYILVVWAGPSVNVRLEDFGREMGRLIGKVRNDVIARIELLEKGSCP